METLSNITSEYSPSFGCFLLDLTATLPFGCQEVPSSIGLHIPHFGPL